MANFNFDEAPTSSKPVERWMVKITDALKREKDYRTKANNIVELYEGKLKDQQPFAILYSNTETLAPSVYNSRPIPVVDRRFKDEDILGRVSAETATRLLKFLIEEDSLEFDPFDDLMEAAVIDGLVTNRGLTRFRYNATELDPEAGGGYAGECVYGEAVRWDKFFHGYARSWKKVPWIGFEHDMTPDEFRREFPEANNVNVENPGNRGAEDKEGGETRQELTGVKIIKVYEIWNKADRKVYFLSPSYKEGYLRELDDPLELKGFFPVPRPLNFQKKITTLVPTPLYCHYEQQAKELNELSNRLRAIIKACKVRGFYDATIDGIEKVLEAEDNTLVPIQNRAAMPEGMAMDKMLWLMPLTELVSAAQTLYEQRQQCKQIIYEITGISDILRGASVASETATAQQIKNQWGTLRLKKFQKQVQRYVKDCFKIMLEIAVTKFEPTTVAAMTNLPYPTQQDKEQAKAQLEPVILQAQMMGQEPQIPPEVTELLQKPSWEEILGLLKNDVLRDYRVEIETNSTIDAEASQDKEDIADLMNAISQFLNGIAPLVEQGVMDIEVAKQLLLTVCRRYTFGPQLEEALQKMKPPEPQPDPKAEADAQKAQAEIQKMQLENEQAAAEFEIEKQMKQLEMAQAQQEHQFKMAEMQAEHQLKLAQLEMERERLGLERQAMGQKQQFQERQHSLKMQQAEENAAMKKKQTKEKVDA